MPAVIGDDDLTIGGQVTALSRKWDAFHSIKNSGTFQAGNDGMEISMECFRKIRTFFNFQHSNHSTENSGNFRRKIKWKENSH